MMTDMEMMTDKEVDAVIAQFTSRARKAEEFSAQSSERDNNHTLQWGEDIGPERMRTLREGEMFTLISEDGVTPYSVVVMDSYERKDFNKGK